MQRVGSERTPSPLLNTCQIYAVTNILYNSIHHYLVEFIESMIQYKLGI